MTFPRDSWYRLVPRGGGGLSCDARGVALGCVDLARVDRDMKGGARCEVRPPDEIGRVLSLAFGLRSDEVAARLHHGLRRAANWIEAGDLCLASIATVMLGIPEPTAEGLAKLAAFGDLEKFGTGWQDQARRPAGQTGGGQWTAGESGDPATAARLDDGVFRPGADHTVVTLVGGVEEEPSRRSNGPPPEVDSLQEVFPGLKEVPGLAIPLAPVDGFLGISRLADEANLQTTMSIYRGLISQIKEIDPSFVDHELLPEGGIAGLSWSGRNNLIDGLLMTRAAALYRVRGDVGPLQVETLRFLQKSVDAAYEEGLKEYDTGRLLPRLSREEAIGNYVDAQVRQNLRITFNYLKIPYGAARAAGSITINNRDYDTSDPSRKVYSVPDARVDDVSFDWTLTRKTISDRQIRGFFAADSKPMAVIIVRPSNFGSNSTYLIPRPAVLRPRR